jgi:hypothetical protein
VDTTGSAPRPDNPIAWNGIGQVLMELKQFATHGTPARRGARNAWRTTTSASV